MNLLPMIQPEIAAADTSLPMYREAAWNFQKDVPIFKNGNPVIVEGKDAVLVWAWKALHTQRFRYEIYTWDYGNEAESLIGQGFTKELQQSEAARYVRECLLINPYITDVTGISTDFKGSRLTVTGTIGTIYGEAQINV